jgi:DNA-binding transcriptional ArsR family regulator
VELLAERELTAGQIADAFAVTRPAISRHLRVLRQAGLASARSEAQRRVYRLEAERLEEAEAWLARYRGYWKGRLDALERHLAQSRPRGRRSGGSR